MKAFLISLLVVTLVAIAAVFGLPALRSTSWKDTRSSTQGDFVPESEADQENAIAGEMAIDTSVYDRRTDVRKIRAIPDSPVALEAVFRQRRNDACEALGDGEPLEMSQFTSMLTSRDKFRTKESLLPTTRREVVTIGLKMLSIDQRQLPTLSRSTILDFLEKHYLSLQARIQKDPKTLEWHLHYRPIAAIGQFRGLPYSQKWEEAIVSTIIDIRGLGMWEDDNDDGTQTAVIIFRSDWLDEAGNKSAARHELVFIHATPAKSESSRDPIKLHFFTTTENRTLWHHFVRSGSKKPRKDIDCDLVGTVRFDEFTRGGLQPKSVVTREIKANSLDHYRVEDINSYLNQEGLEGGWNKNLRRALRSILDNEIPKYHDAL